MIRVLIAIAVTCVCLFAQVAEQPSTVPGSGSPGGSGVGIRVNNVDISNQPYLNFLSGLGITPACAQDAGNSENECQMVLTFPSETTWRGASCQQGVPATAFDLKTANIPTPTCADGTNVTTGFLTFSKPATEQSVQGSVVLPSGWTGAVDAKIKWRTSATTGDVKWAIQLACIADAETSDPSFNSPASTVTDTAKGTTLQENDATISNITTTGCAAGETMHFRFYRVNSGDGADTLATTADLKSMTLVIRKAL